MNADFDFDGIIIDSVREVVVTAHNAVTGELRVSLEEIPEHVRESFLLNRFHFRLAGESVPLMEWCIHVGSTEPTRLLTPAEYARIIEQDTSSRMRRTELFFATRQKFIDAARTGWLALNAPYEPLFTKLKSFGAERIVILTNKNREAVIEITHFFGLPLVRENVYSGDGGRLKTENLLEIRKRFSAEKYWFIDDSLENLREVGAFSVAEGILLRTLLGAWGYLGPNDLEHAEQEGIPVFAQHDLIQLIEQEMHR